MKIKLLTLILLLSTSLYGQKTPDCAHKTVMNNFIVGVDNYSTIMKKMVYMKGESVNKKSIYNKSKNILTVKKFSYGYVVGDIEFYFSNNLLYCVCYMPKLSKLETLRILHEWYGKPYDIEEGYIYRWTYQNIVVQFLPYDGIYYYDKTLFPKYI